MKQAGAKIAALFLGAACALPGPAAAQETTPATQNITAVISQKMRGNDSGISMTMIDKLGSVHACLNLGWVFSHQTSSDDYASNVHVACLQEGEIIAAQACYDGECKAITPTPRP